MSLRRIRGLTVASTLGMALALLGSPTASQEVQDWSTRAAQRIRMLQQDSAPSHEPSGAINVGALDESRSAVHPLVVISGERWTVIAVCDGCGDMDVVAYDALGRPEASDVRPGGDAVVHLAGNERFRVAVEMIDCRSAPCGYALQFFRQPD